MVITLGGEAGGRRGGERPNGTHGCESDSQKYEQLTKALKGLADSCGVFDMYLLQTPLRSYVCMYVGSTICCKFPSALSCRFSLLPSPFSLVTSQLAFLLSPSSLRAGCAAGRRA